MGNMGMMKAQNYRRVSLAGSAAPGKKGVPKLRTRCLQDWPGLHFLQEEAEAAREGWLSLWEIQTGGTRHITLPFDAWCSLVLC